MYTHPHISSQIGCERQRDKLAHAEQQRLARQLRTLSGAARHANRPARRLGGALRPAGLRTVVARITGYLARQAIADQVQLGLPAGREIHPARIGDPRQPAPGLDLCLISGHGRKLTPDRTATAPRPLTSGSARG